MSPVVRQVFRRVALPAAALTVFSVSAHTLLPAVGITVADGVISDVVSFSFGALVTGGLAVAQKAFRPEVDGVSEALVRRNASHLASGAEGAVAAEALGVVKRRLEGSPGGDMSSLLIAKYWILRGDVPAGKSRTAAMLELDDLQDRDYAGQPLISGDDALRIVAATVAASDPEARALISVPADDDRWTATLAELEAAMVHAHFYALATAEEGGFGRHRLARHDVPDAEHIETFFFLTGRVPHLPRRELTSALRQMQQHRATPVDPVLARRAVLGLLAVGPTHDLLLPPTRDRASAWDLLPAGLTPLPSAADDYESALDYPEGVRGSFVGTDGWHYLRTAAGRGTERVLAARGDAVISLVDTGERVQRRWDMLEAERATAKLSLFGEDDLNSATMAANLSALRAISAAHNGHPQYVAFGGDDDWAPARSRMQQWLGQELPATHRVNPLQELVSALMIRRRTDQMLRSGTPRTLS